MTSILLFLTSVEAVEEEEEEEGTGSALMAAIGICIVGCWLYSDVQS